MTASWETVLRALGTALAGISTAFAVYMLAYGGGKTRINGMEHLAIFAQPRGAAAPDPVKASGAAPSASDSPIDLAATGSVPSSAGQAAPVSRPVEIVAAQPDRVWLKINGAIRAATPGDSIEGLGRIGAIVERDGGWVLLDDKGATLLGVSKGANGAPLFTRKMIFE